MIPNTYHFHPLPAVQNDLRMKRRPNRFWTCGIYTLWKCLVLSIVPFLMSLFGVYLCPSESPGNPVGPRNQYLIWAHMQRQRHLMSVELQKDLDEVLRHSMKVSQAMIEVACMRELWQMADGRGGQNETPFREIGNFFFFFFGFCSFFFLSPNPFFGGCPVLLTHSQIMLFWWCLSHHLFLRGFVHGCGAIGLDDIMSRLVSSKKNTCGWFCLRKLWMLSHV